TGDLIGILSVMIAIIGIVIALSSNDDTDRRTELIAIIYDRTNCGLEDVSQCPHQASTKERVEAAKAFVALEKAQERQPDLANSNLREADLSGVNLSEVNLSDADLTGAVFLGANLSKANLSGTDLGGANLTGANLSRASINNVNLNDADLTGANLSEADLTNTDLTNAAYNNSTKWPDGFNPFEYGAINLDEVGEETE
ncbi:MAG: pentapeptide repeat-containing protein, partial [Chloroflexota bacterium]